MDFNDDNNEKMSKAEKVIDIAMNAIIIHKIVMITLFIVPIVVFIVTAIVVGNKIVSLNGAVTVLRVLFSVLAVLNIGIYIYHKIKKNNRYFIMDVTLFVLGIVFIGVLIYTAFFTPVKVFNYANKDYVTIDEYTIPTLYKYSKYDKAFLSFRLKEDTDIKDENGNIYKCNIDCIILTFLNEKSIPQECLDGYEKELRNQGYIEYIDIENTNEHKIYYKINEEKNEMIYISFDKNDVAYGKLTSAGKLPEMKYIDNTKL